MDGVTEEKLSEFDQQVKTVYNMYCDEMREKHEETLASSSELREESKKGGLNSALAQLTTYNLFCLLKISELTILLGRISEIASKTLERQKLSEGEKCQREKMN